MSDIHVTRLNKDLSSIIDVNLHETKKPVAECESNQQMVNALWRAAKFPSFVRIYERVGLDQLAKFPSFQAMTKEDERAFLKYFELYKKGVVKV